LVQQPAHQVVNRLLEPGNQFLVSCVVSGLEPRYQMMVVFKANFSLIGKSFQFLHRVFEFDIDDWLCHGSAFRGAPPSTYQISNRLALDWTPSSAGKFQRPAVTRRACP
jgi:hypothetical protein